MEENEALKIIETALLGSRKIKILFERDCKTLAPYIMHMTDTIDAIQLSKDDYLQMHRIDSTPSRNWLGRDCFIVVSLTCNLEQNANYMMFLARTISYYCISAEIVL